MQSAFEKELITISTRKSELERIAESNEKIRSKLAQREKILEEFSRKMEQFDSEIKGLEQHKKDLESRFKAKKRKQRTHMLIRLGAVVQSLTGCRLTDANINAFYGWLEQHKGEILFPDAGAEEVAIDAEEVKSCIALVRPPQKKPVPERAAEVQSAVAENTANKTTDKAKEPQE